MLSSRGIALPRFQLFDLDCTHVFSLCKNDGVGAQLHAQVSVIAYARAKGLTYIHAPIVELAHFAGGNPSLRMAAPMAAQMDNFFNLGFGEMTLLEAAQQNITACGVKHCHRFFDSHAGAAGGPACYNSIKYELLQKYLHAPKPPPLSSSASSLALRVAVHVRRGDVSRAAAAERYTDNEFYSAVLSGIKATLPPYLRPLHCVRGRSLGLRIHRPPASQYAPRVGDRSRDVHAPVSLSRRARDGQKLVQLPRCLVQHRRGGVRAFLACSESRVAPNARSPNPLQYDSNAQFPRKPHVLEELEVPSLLLNRRTTLCCCESNVTAPPSNFCCPLIPHASAGV